MVLGWNLCQGEVNPLCVNMNSVKIEAITNIKFMVTLGWKNEGIITALIKVYGDDSPKKNAIYK